MSAHCTLGIFTIKIIMHQITMNNIAVGTFLIISLSILLELQSAHFYTCNMHLAVVIWLFQDTFSQVTNFEFPDPRGVHVL